MGASTFSNNKQSLSYRSSIPHAASLRNRTFGGYDYTALPGWIVLVVRRHIEAVAELSGEEAAELGRLIAATSQALHEVTGCVKTYAVQFAEAAEHPHVHVHVVPRMADQPPDRRGPRIFGYLGVPEHERVGEDAMNSIASDMRTALAKRCPSGD